MSVMDNLSEQELLKLYGGPRNEAVKVEPGYFQSGSKTGAALTGYGQGASLGLGKYVGAGLGWLSGGTYAQNLKSQEDYRAAQQEANPGSYLAGELGGSVIPLTGIGKVGKVISGGPATPISTGAIAGGISGGAAYQPEGYTPTGVATNAVLGGAGGAALGALGTGVGYLGNKIASGMGGYTYEKAQEDAIKVLLAPKKVSYKNPIPSKTVNTNMSVEEFMSKHPDKVKEMNTMAQSNIIGYGENSNAMSPLIHLTGGGVGGAALGYGLNAAGVKDVGGIPVNAVTGALLGTGSVAKDFGNLGKAVIAKGYAAKTAGDIARESAGTRARIESTATPWPEAWGPATQQEKQDFFNNQVQQKMGNEPPNLFANKGDNPQGVGSGFISNVYGAGARIPAGFTGQALGQTPLVGAAGESLRNLSNSLTGQIPLTPNQQPVTEEQLLQLYGQPKTLGIRG